MSKMLIYILDNIIYTNLVGISSYIGIYICNIWIYNHLLSRMQHLPSAGVAKKGTWEFENLRRVSDSQIRKFPFSGPFCPGPGGE